MASRPQDLLQLLTRAERLSVRRVQSVLDEFDCSVEAWRVLALLSEGGHHMSAIADCTSMPAPTLTKLVDQLVDQKRVGSQRIGGDLSMQHLAGDVGVVGRDLPPALRSVDGSDPYEPDPAIAERLERADAHSGGHQRQHPQRTP